MKNYLHFVEKEAIIILKGYRIKKRLRVCTALNTQVSWLGILHCLHCIVVFI